MVRFIFIAIALLWSVPFTNAQQQNKICVQNDNSCVPVNSTNPFPVTGTINASSAATATAAAPSYVEGSSNPFSQNLTGDLRVIAKQSTSPWITAGGGTAGSAATGVSTIQGIASMTPVQVSQATAANLNATIIGTGTFATQSAITAASGAIVSGAVASGAYASGSIASGAFASGSIASGAMVDLIALSTPITPATATATKAALLGMQYNSTQATFTNGQQGSVQGSVRGAIYVATGADTFNVTVNAALAAGSNEIGGVNQTKIGGTAVVADPCQSSAKTYTPISITTATTTKIITGASAKKTYICQLILTSAAADNVAIIEGTTGGTCGSGTAGLLGGVTAANGPNFPANGGLSLGNGASAVLATATNQNDFCLITSASTPLAGSVAWVQQ